MALKLEDLKVGESILDTWGDEVVLEYIKNDTALLSGNGRHYLQSTDSLLRNYSPKPNPKKKLELVKFLHDDGVAHEVLGGSADFSFYSKSSEYTRISSRTIEVEDDK